MKDRIRVLLADDHLVVRMGLSALLTAQSDMEVVGEAADGDAAIRLARQLHPDVVVMDLMMPNKSGVEATQIIKDELPTANILVLTTYGDSRDVSRALSAGAIGALIKDCSKSDLISAIHDAAKGNHVISPEIESSMARAPFRPMLSPRHTEILQLIARGFTNPEIAKRLGISRNCVKIHLSTAYARLGASSRAEAVTMAIDAGLINP